MLQEILEQLVEDRLSLEELPELPAPGEVHTTVLQCLEHTEEFPVLQSTATCPEHLRLRRSQPSVTALCWPRDDFGHWLVSLEDTQMYDGRCWRPARSRRSNCRASGSSSNPGCGHAVHTLTLVSLSNVAV